MPHSGLLQDLPIAPPVENQNANIQAPQPPSNLHGTGTQNVNSGPPSNSPAEAQLKQYLAAPGLPTISQKLANYVWELDFIETDEFLPPNKAIQALEGSGLSESEVSGPSSQPQPQSRRTMDVMAWIRCFNLYIAVMTQRRPELTGPMAALSPYWQHVVVPVRLEDTQGDLCNWPS